MAWHVHGHFRYFPMGGCDLGPLDRELSAFFEMSEETPSEFNLIYKLAVYADQLLLGINPSRPPFRGGPFPRGKESGRQDWA